MTDFYIRSGVTGLTIPGIMGEVHKLDPAEALAISNQVVRRSKIPIIVGVSAPGFAAMRSLVPSVSRECGLRDAADAVDNDAGVEQAVDSLPN
jgi:dihydrodipicolinate synthase/N-acetylneuraminate lyase